MFKALEELDEVEQIGPDEEIEFNTEAVLCWIWETYKDLVECKDEKAEEFLIFTIGKLTESLNILSEQKDV